MSVELYRVFHALADGRKVYITDRPYSAERAPEVVRRELAEGAVYLWDRNGRQLECPAVDPWVYTAALDHYGQSSRLRKDGAPEPFVEVVSVAIEPANSPVDPEAYLFGGIQVGRGSEG